MKRLPTLSIVFLTSLTCLIGIAQTPGNTARSLPPKLYECDILPTRKICATWLLLPRPEVGPAVPTYWGAWQGSGSVSIMTVTRFDGTHLEVSRNNSSDVWVLLKTEGFTSGRLGPLREITKTAPWAPTETTGPTATYTGIWNGSQISEGKMSWSWNGYSAVNGWSLSSVEPGSLTGSGQEKPIAVKTEQAMKLLINPLPTPAIGGATARNAGTEATSVNGTVRVEFTVLPLGNVTDVTKADSTGDSFDLIFPSIQSLVSQLFFHPYIAEGMPAAMRTSMEARFTKGAGQWVWSDPSVAPPALVVPTVNDLTATTSQATGPSAGSAYKGPNAEWVHMVLATIGPYKCDGSYRPPPTGPSTCQRDAKIHEAQMIAFSAECLAAGGDENRSSTLAMGVMLDLKAAGALCGKAGEPATCATDQVLPCSQLPK